MTEPTTPNLQFSPTRRLQLGAHEIGDGCRIFVIAEAGVNHNGEVSAALEMIDAAASAGADAVKFQIFRASALTTSTVKTAAYQKANSREASQHALLSKLELSNAALDKIAERCGQRGVVFLATPFSVPDVDRLVARRVPAIKIASTDLVDNLLIDRACAASVPLLLSTGAADGYEIARAVTWIASRGAWNRVVLLHCVSRYPTPVPDANLRAVTTLRQRFATLVGSSDHTLSVQTGAWAVCAGACLLEKHFTLDRKAQGPDHAMSLLPGELAAYIAAAREAQQALGDGALSVQAAENEIRRVARKTVVAARSISRGETLTAEMLTCKRAGAGLSPSEIPALLGRKAAVPLDEDAPLTLEMVQ